MLDELRELYQEVILDHGKNPRNYRAMPEANHLAHGDNPLCGDKITIYMQVDDDGRIADVSFDGRGCAISQASASMMTEILTGKTLAEMEALFSSFHAMCTDDNYDPAAYPNADEDALDRLQVMSGVREFPMRVKCATLAWHTMQAAVNGEQSATTE